MNAAWPDGRVFRLTPGEDAPEPMRHVVTVAVYAPGRVQMRVTLRVLAIFAARRCS